ncbi:hypothetical protein SAMN05421854_106418 [Amycolatopsis rubida]|uniref:Uncharacterized protein n=1 Tax=Amycolatopsis rubida TaxID=112413 RepID=A0A1I5SQU7_9PSEU|nr:hypothetical protein SAMN05421854_106418 [Amycolatopsis rubida]
MTETWAGAGTDESVRLYRDVRVGDVQPAKKRSNESLGYFARGLDELTSGCRGHAHVVISAVRMRVPAHSGTHLVGRKYVAHPVDAEPQSPLTLVSSVLVTQLPS